MKILYICPRLPYPPNQGDKVVIHNNLKYLSVRNEITLLTFVENDKEREGVPALRRYCRSVEAFKRRRNFSFLNIILAAFSTAPFTVIRYYSRQMLERAKRLIESGGFDVIHVDFYYMAQYVMNRDIKIPGTTATILTAHNIEQEVYSMYARFERALMKKLFARVEAMRIGGYEPKLFGKFDNCIAFCERDKTNMQALSGASNIRVNPVIAEPAPAARAPAAQEPDSIAFFGRLNTLPNDDAVRFFYEKIFPLIKKEIPSVKFFIAGRAASVYVQKIKNDPDVKFVGEVPDLGAFLAGVRVVVVPLRIGGGMRIKILDAWANGKAVVSTAVGAEGLEYADRQDIVIADTPSDFKDAVVRLLRDNGLRQGMERAAVAKVAGVYNPGKIIGGLEKIYREALESKKKKAS